MLAPPPLDLLVRPLAGQPVLPISATKVDRAKKHIKENVTRGNFVGKRRGYGSIIGTPKHDPWESLHLLMTSCDLFLMCWKVYSDSYK